MTDEFVPINHAPAPSWLRSDVSIECNTPEYDAVTALSWLAIVAYPIGLLVGCLLLLRQASDAIVSGKATHLSRAIDFLHTEYKVTTFWWELMEMLRKFLLVGLFVILKPGSIMQLAVGTTFCAAFLMVQLQASPYKMRSDSTLF